MGDWELEASIQPGTESRVKADGPCCLLRVGLGAPLPMCRGHCQGDYDELLAFSGSCSKDVRGLDRVAASCWVVAGWGWAGGSREGGTEPTLPSACLVPVLGFGSPWPSPHDAHGTV